jgi:hypothetical protein
MLGNILGGMIIIVVGVNLMPIVANTVAATRWNGSGLDPNGIGTNVTGVTITLLNLVVLFYALGIMSSAIAIAAEGLRAAGLLGV